MKDDVLLRGVGGDFMLRRMQWLTAMILVGLHSRWKRDYFRAGPGLLTDEEANHFAEDLAAAVGRLPDKTSSERPVHFTWWLSGENKGVAHRLVAFAREGAFEWLEGSPT
jgi:hypothetical protein